jgi:hypothetical protein
LLAAKQGVAGKGELEFVDGIDFREGADEAAATFAMEVFDGVIGNEGVEEAGEGVVMQGDGRVCWRVFVSGDEEVDFTAGFAEKRVIGRDDPGFGNDAA